MTGLEGAQNLTVADKQLTPDEGVLTESPKMTNIHEIVEDTAASSENGDSEAKEIAAKIRAGTLENVEFTEYANYLGTPGNDQILREFLLLLDPLPSSITGTLRKLSSSLYFIAEAANLDTILEALSRQWLSEHNKAHYQDNYKLCHIVMFALLMLNSTLHNSEADLSFTIEEFRENTINALQKESPDIDVPSFNRELSLCYYQLDNEQLPLLRPPSQPRYSLSGRRTNGNGGHSNMKKASMLSLERFQTNQSLISTQNSMATLTSRDTTANSNYRMRNNKPLQKLYLDEPFDAELQDLNGTPWLMDSMVNVQEASKANNSTSQLLSSPVTRKRKLMSWFRKHTKDTIFNENIHAADTDNWQHARIRIYQGRLFVYKFKGFGRERSIPRDIHKWSLEMCKRSCSQFHVYNLYGTIASLVQENIVASENSNVSSASFLIDFPHGLDSTSGLSFRFKTRNQDEAKQFTACCNFWSARISPIPSAQVEMISNEEYGWSPRLLEGESGAEQVNLAQVKLAHWKPLVGLDAIFSELDEGIALWDFDSQLGNLRVFTELLGAQLDEHNAVKPKMVELWAKKGREYQPQFEAAMENWNNKYLYLNKQYQKHLVYLKALENAVQFYERSKSVKNPETKNAAKEQS
ncbi:Arf family guanine nucleotide exchange factor YEL1 [Lachancea thermotolerans CBS 6340]|uniref:Guanine-nucleotide exchange factor YEL1 n=1 Tax=Lachancea thermotolerans (strain ATCC 56472 / CBS 6340 / NRRL Y-8284) TaxID=559295 RepID=YEL1_LACTC|nr:KLTH0C06864p [Lachancea thermotolerans CBS 6340]C5DE74.1 RecName: Full=Guanine-nucleotide exchange factor YEL1 [Lachancea thermotolerans CBS 6340]CAR22085.1 KLTH0C06864p [Lachancea thermotolerans CBS 6340]